MTLEYLHDDKWLEVEAQLLLEDHPAVLAAFLRLTDEGALHLRTDPRAESLKWDSWNPPSDADIDLDVAVRLLMELGFVGEVTRQAKSDYLVPCSEKAKEVRSVYERLPERLAGTPSEASDSAR